MRILVLLGLLLTWSSCSDTRYSPELKPISFHAYIHVDDVPAEKAKFVLVVNRFIDNYTGFAECVTDEDGEINRELPASKNLSVITISKIVFNGFGYHINYQVCNVSNGDSVVVELDLIDFQ